MKLWNRGGCLYSHKITLFTWVAALIYIVFPRQFVVHFWLILFLLYGYGNLFSWKSRNLPFGLYNFINNSGLRHLTRSTGQKLIRKCFRIDLWSSVFSVRVIVFVPIRFSVLEIHSNKLTDMCFNLGLECQCSMIVVSINVSLVKCIHRLEFLLFL